MKTIAIIDYGVGNLRSVSRGIIKAGGKPVVTSDIEMIAGADGIILPGVGAFSEGMMHLAPLQEVLVNSFNSVPILGICLGMQMLMELSEEHGMHKGVGLIPGVVRRFPEAKGYKIPHMGWNTIYKEQDDPLFEGIPDESFVYFVHSYYADTAPAYTLTSTSHICRFASSIRNGTAWGVQFHPEKSGETGLAILRNFLAL